MMKVNEKNMNYYTLFEKGSEISAVEYDEPYSNEVVSRFNQAGFAMLVEKFPSCSKDDAIRFWKNKKRNGISKTMQIFALLLTLPGCLIWSVISIRSDAILALLIHIYIAYVPITGFKYSPVTVYVSVVLVAHFNYVLFTKYASDYSMQAFIAAWGMMVGSIILCIGHLMLLSRCKKFIP